MEEGASNIQRAIVTKRETPPFIYVQENPFSTRFCGQIDGPADRQRPPSDNNSTAPFLARQALFGVNATNGERVSPSASFLILGGTNEVRPNQTKGGG